MSPAHVPKPTLTSRARKIDELMERASESLVCCRYFECERDAAEALRLAHAVRDYERMARIVMPLQEARRQKRLQAFDAGEVTEVSAPDTVGAADLRAGCYLLLPPACVGLDGRLLRDLANRERVPVIVLVREPLTMTGEWPIVAVGPVTLRVRVPPVESGASSSSSAGGGAGRAKRGRAGKGARGEGGRRGARERPSAAGPERLSPEWFLRTIDRLGEEALRRADAPSASMRVEQLLQALEAAPEHEGVHLALAEACRSAVHETIDPRRRRRSEAATERSDGEFEEEGEC